MVVSPIKDSLKLLFSDEYNISDSDYRALSEILVSNGLSENAFSDGIVQLVKLLYENQIKLPASLNYLQDVWTSSNMPIPLVKVITPSIRKGIIKIRKVNKDMFFKHKTLIRTDDEPDQKKYIVVYNTDVLNNLFGGFSSILSKYKKKKVIYTLDESVSVTPRKVVSFVDKANKLLSVYNITIDIESYMKDLANNLEEINLIVTGTSRYRLSDKDIQKRAKGLKSVKCVHGIETYKEGNSELFIGLTTNIESNYSDIPLKLFEFIEDLEVNGV